LIYIPTTIQLRINQERTATNTKGKKSVILVKISGTVRRKRNLKHYREKEIFPALLQVSTTVTVKTAFSCAYALDYPNACIANGKSSLNFLIGRLRSRVFKDNHFGA